MSKITKHIGIVCDQTEYLYRVRITSHTACSSCHAKGACSSADLQDKIIDIDKENCRKLNIGESVNVVISQNSAIFAVVIAYTIPILLIILIMVLSIIMEIKQGIAAFMILGSLVIYFTLLFILKNKLKARINISAE